MFETVDTRDVIYSVVGLALLGLTLQPALQRYRIFNLPFFYVAFGAFLAGVGVIRIDPLTNELQSAIIEHASELIVIISLAGAGLAIDTVGGWRSWNPTWRLLAVTMPLTMLTVAIWGGTWLGLGVPGAILLAAALAPTDPVLARSVQVSPPGQAESGMEVALTAEAGMNDGLAFPFVYLAVHAATLGVAGMTQADGWIWSWLGFDLVYRVGAGIVVGHGIGWLLSRIIFSPIGDGSQGAWNAVVVILSSTLISYGVTEAVDGYGFLAVFFATRAGRARTRGTEDEGYEKYVHHGAEQLEAILLAILLLWLGTFAGSGLLAETSWTEVVFALALILVVRPLAGMIALVGQDCPGFERRSVAFFGIRGMGTVFYVAYAQSHADFADIDAIWRICVIVILASIFIHGYAANVFLQGEDLVDAHPDRKAEED